MEIDRSTRKATLLLLLECNARCPFCSMTLLKQEGVDLPQLPGTSLPVVTTNARDHRQSFEEMKAAYDSLIEQGIHKVNLGGGEPTMWPDLCKLLAYGNKVGMEEQLLTSNGMRFRNAAYARQVVEAGPSTIILSLFGARPETHDRSFQIAGLFDAVTAGLENLLTAMKDLPKGKHIGITGQMSLHRWNYHELPEMVRYWYGKGIRHFNVRLLRDSPATERFAPEDSWFFDVAKLREPLEQMLDDICFIPDIRVSMAEVLYCLLSPSYFGFVLKDLGSNPDLFGTNLRVARHGPVNAINRFDTIEVGSECGKCDLKPVCSPLRTCHLDHFTGQYKAVRVAERIEALARGTFTQAEALRLRPLMEAKATLDDIGVPEEQKATLSRVYWEALQRRPDLLARELLRDHEQQQIRDLFQRTGPLPVAVTTLKLSDFGGDGSLRGDPHQILARLKETATTGQRPKLEFLADRTHCVVSSDRLMLFSYERPESKAGPRTLVLVPLFDDTRLDEATALGMLAPFVEGSRAQA